MRALFPPRATVLRRRAKCRAGVMSVSPFSFPGLLPGASRLVLMGLHRLCRRLVDRGHNLDQAVLHGHIDAEAAELAAGLHLHVATFRAATFPRRRPAVRSFGSSRIRPDS